MSSQHHIGIGRIEKIAVDKIGVYPVKLLVQPGGDQLLVDTGLQIRHGTNLENRTRRSRELPHPADVPQGRGGVGSLSETGG